jgi:hypothetical protein
MRRSIVRSALSVVLTCVGCSSPGAAPDASVDARAPIDGHLPARACRSGRAWSPGMPAFRDRTDSWGLAMLNGNDFGVADVDGDGFPDLVVNAGSAYDRTPGHVFLNRPAAGGRTFVDGTAAAHLYDVRGSSTETGRSVTHIRFGDVDNDGDADAFTGTFMYLTDASRMPLPDHAEIMLNDGHGVFSFAPATITQPDHPLTSDADFFDQDLDGRLDLAIGYWWEQPPFTTSFGMQPQMFRGDGTGSFVDVTDAVNMTLGGDVDSFFAGHSRRPLFGLVTCDVNDDGRMDLVGAAYGRQINELFVAQADGTFQEIGASTLVGEDQRTDYTDDQSFRCYCQANPSTAMCAGRPAPAIPCNAFGGRYLRGWQPGLSDAPVSLGGNTFSYACGDFDNDGDLDLYESNIRHPDVGSASDPSEVLVNESTADAIVFTRPGRETMGLVPPIDLARTDEGGQHDAAFDFDNDGRLDLLLDGSPYPGNRGWLFHQQRSGTLSFEWIGADAGFYHPCALGSAIADFDRDGDLDLITGTYGCNDPASSPDWMPPENQPVRFYENVSTDANWIAIRLIGSGAGGANRDGLGARVRVTAGGVTQTALVRGSSQNASFEPLAWFGLGDACDVDRVEIRWPDATLTTTTLEGLVANYVVEVSQADGSVRFVR